MGCFVRRAAAFVFLSCIVFVSPTPAAAYPGENKDVAAECAKPAGCVFDARSKVATEAWAEAAFAPVCDAHRVCYATRTKTKATCDGELDAKLKAACTAASKDAATCTGTTNRYRDALIREGGRTQPALQQCARNVTLANIKSDLAAVGPEALRILERLMAPQHEQAQKSVEMTKATVEADASAVKASTLRIFQLAGMTYTPPLPAQGNTVTPLQPKVPTGAACALKTGPAQQLCNLAEAVRPLGDRAHTQPAPVLAPLLAWRDELDVDWGNWVRRRAAEHGEPALKLRDLIAQREAQGPVDEAYTAQAEQQWRSVMSRFHSVGDRCVDYATDYKHHIVLKAEPLKTAFAADRAKAAELQNQAEAIVAQPKRVVR